MKTIIVDNYEELSKKAGEIIVSRVKKNPYIHLGLATGSTPEGTYEYMVNDHKQNGTSYKNVITFNLDEYVGLAEDHPESYRRFMNEKLLNHIDIPINQTHVPLGNTDNLEEECSRYEQLIENHGGIDFQLLGIGRNGHIGFNEPGTPFDSKTHVVQLTDATKEQNSIYFGGADKVPTKAITMGINTIMRSKEILLLISGESKRDAVKQFFEGKIDESFPASCIKTHPNATVIIDKESAALLNQSTINQIIGLTV